MHEKVKYSPTDLPSLMREKVEISQTDSPNLLRGIRRRTPSKRYTVEIRPPRWKQKIWLGSYRTLNEAERAFDVANHYIDKEPYYFQYPKNSFVALPPVSFEDSWKSKSSMKLFGDFLKKQAKEAARKALDDPAWKRTHERCLQVGRFVVGRFVVERFVVGVGQWGNRG
ncbi:unnamed protein product [Sphagnum jensenii]|uniref:AP2/ERF domain-containing protein n=1 Tax=Sphagnum jensenii TaxID=128206 RepID=A0ABP1A2D4_9BRYO